MARGILIVDKPAGWTSHDVVAKCRRVFSERRVGHAGTLDPMATGVLPIFLGRATRAVEFAAVGDKTYEAKCLLGTVTDTQDTTGQILETNKVNITSEQLEVALAQFRGPIEQVPPMYSAVKINGQKLYNLARAGREVAREPRPVTIHSLALNGREGDTLRLTIRCSKGTYIRTLCHDLGQALGCGASMSGLRRTDACGFSLAQAIGLEALLVHENPQSLLLPEDSLFLEHDAVNITPNQEKYVRNGASFAIPLADGTYRVYSQNHDFLMLGQVADGIMSTIKSFFEVTTS